MGILGPVAGCLSTSPEYLTVEPLQTVPPDRWDHLPFRLSAFGFRLSAAPGTCDIVFSYTLVFMIRRAVPFPSNVRRVAHVLVSVKGWLHDHTLIPEWLQTLEICIARCYTIFILFYSHIDP
jgi:hypothetical protein